MKKTEAPPSSPLVMIERALGGNRACSVSDRGDRAFFGYGWGRPEVVVLVAIASPGFIYGHVVYDRVITAWRSFLLHSSVVLTNGRELNSFRDEIVEGESYSPVYTVGEGATSGVTNTFDHAVNALCWMIRRYDPDDSWPEEPGPLHSLDFTPFDAYRFIQRLAR